MRKIPDTAKLDRIVTEARRNREQREQDYRERALKLYPWVCGAAHANSPAPTFSS